MMVSLRGLTNPGFPMYPLQNMSVERVVDSTLNLHMLLMGCHCLDFVLVNKANKIARFHEIFACEVNVEA